MATNYFTPAFSLEGYDSILFVLILFCWLAYTKYISQSRPTKQMGCAHCGPDNGVLCNPCSRVAYRYDYTYICPTGTTAVSPLQSVSAENGLHDSHTDSVLFCTAFVTQTMETNHLRARQEADVRYIKLRSAGSRKESPGRRSRKAKRSMPKAGSVSSYVSGFRSGDPLEKVLHSTSDPERVPLRSERGKWRATVRSACFFCCRELGIHRELGRILYRGSLTFGYPKNMSLASI